MWSEAATWYKIMREIRQPRSGLKYWKRLPFCPWYLRDWVACTKTDDCFFACGEWLSSAVVDWINNTTKTCHSHALRPFGGLFEPQQPLSRNRLESSHPHVLLPESLWITPSAFDNAWTSPHGCVNVRGLRGFVKFTGMKILRGWMNIFHADWCQIFANQRDANDLMGRDWESWIRIEI